uniref:GP-PDE domain-containing protein n=1 Tax=Steinernema glaseri TaxID=37863 RepID=A0A1I7Z436_9BILA
MRAASVPYACVDCLWTATQKGFLCCKETKVRLWITSILSLACCCYVLLDSVATILKFWDNGEVPVYVSVLGHLNGFVASVGLLPHVFVFYHLINGSTSVQLHPFFLVYLVYQIYVLGFSSVSIGLLSVLVFKHPSTVVALVLSVIVCAISISNMFTFIPYYRKLEREAKQRISANDRSVSEKSFSEGP